MTLGFQDSLLRFLFQDKTAKKYKDYLDESVFDVPMMQLVYGLWYAYVSKYNNIPTKTNFLEFTDREVKKKKGLITADVYTEMLNVIAVTYTIDNNDYDFSRDVIVEYARRKGTRNVFTQNADKLKNATVEQIDDIYHQMQRVVNIGTDTEEADRNRGGMMFRDAEKPNHDIIVEGHPTFLHGINKVTAAGGFYSPQLILLMGGPKAFKTGTLLTIMVEYARMGLNVFIADFENGINSIKMRIKQCLLECERGEVNQYTTELKTILKKIRLYGGDIVPHFFPAGISTLDDVDRELERLATEQNWTPDVILYDYLLKAGCANKKVFEKRLQITDVYDHAVRLNNKYKCFAFTATKVKQDAVSKLVIDTQDFGESFAQAYDCHATFALCRTASEQREGTARIVPVLQREGLQYSYGPRTTCAIKIVPETQTITELDAEAYTAVMEDEYQAKTTKTSKRRYIDMKDLKDE